MRIAFDLEGHYHVVHVEYESITAEEDGVNYLFLLGMNPFYITDSFGYTYEPEHFVWIWDRSETTEKPYYTTDPDFNIENIYEVEYFDELDLSELSEQYLRGYYAEDDPDYLSFIKVFNKPEEDTIITNYDIQPVIHLFMVANTSIGDIGKSCEIDKYNILSEFEGIAGALNIDLKKYIISGKEFSKKNLIKTMQSIIPNSEDIVFFIYSGHGFRWNDQDDYYPQLDLRNNNYQDLNTETSLSLSAIYNAFIAKGARLTFILGDCCNSEVGIKQTTNSSFLATKSNRNYNKQYLSKLFFDYSGSLIATAASPGEYSWSNGVNGGFFTSSFLQAIREEISILNDDVPDWDELVDNTLRIAKQKTSPSNCPVCSAQNGLKYSKITSE